MRHYFYSLILFLIVLQGAAQRPIEGAADLLQEIKKLNVLTNVLYVAAHPDDENTRLIAWLENEKLARTAYLSLTRGDGGQNLVGSEKGDAMGVLRTQELLEARKIDGAEQFFSRAVDFGYSKTAEETFEKWNKEKILADVVWTIRKFKPDVIITRFPPDSRGGHGHHTASAMLAEEAFKLAGSDTAFQNQFKRNYQTAEGIDKDCYVCESWQSKRILWNTSVWWDRQLPEKAAKADDYIKINIGDYNELLGLSYSEIAADSRSQHKSQGFGSSRSRGNQLEYLKHTAGEKAETDLFDGINTTWSRVEGSKAIQKKISEIIAQYDLSKPSRSVQSLVELYQLMEPLKENFYVMEKRKDLKRIIKSAAGIHVEALAKQYNYPTHGSSMEGNFTIISRSNVPVYLLEVKPKLDSTFEKIKLKPNELHTFSFSHSLATHPSQPYWLASVNGTWPDSVKDQLKSANWIHKKKVFDLSENSGSKGELEKVSSKVGDVLDDPEQLVYPGEKKMAKLLSGIIENIDDQIVLRPRQYGMPESLPRLVFNYVLEVNGVEILFEEPIDYKWTDRVDGELHRDIIISPPVTATPSEKVYVMSDEQEQKINVLLEANTENYENTIWLNAPEGWQVEPKSIHFKLEESGEQKLLQFKLTPPTQSSIGDIEFKLGKRKSKMYAVQRIDYPHIKPQVIFPWARSRVVKMELEKKVSTIGYIEGSGDDVAENLEQIGFNVTNIEAKNLATIDLSQFETIIVGIRAYNTEESMKNGNAILNEYVKKGGNVIVQYNTSRGLKSDEIGPYSFRISRKRVTKEDAEPVFLNPEHPLLNMPNKLSKEDFEGWVQERGLYFADQWDENYESIIGWNDPGEELQKGSILVADYGEGHFIYTGISFFRQLPAGVPGAYRLLANMISYGK